MSVHTDIYIYKENKSRRKPATKIGADKNTIQTHHNKQVFESSPRSSPFLVFTLDFVFPSGHLYAKITLKEIFKYCLPFSLLLLELSVPFTLFYNSV